MSDRTFTVIVLGTPAPQGSKRHVGGGRMIESSKHVAPWRQAVIHCCVLADVYGILLRNPVRVDITFRLQRPKGHYGVSGLPKPSAPFAPAVKPDLDKLVRSTLDGLTDAAVWRDDSQVIELAARKTYATHADRVGALIEIAVEQP